MEPLSALANAAITSAETTVTSIAPKIATEVLPTVIPSVEAAGKVGTIAANAEATITAASPGDALQTFLDTEFASSVKTPPAITSSAPTAEMPSKQLDADGTELPVHEEPGIDGVADQLLSQTEQIQQDLMDRHKEEQLNRWRMLQTTLVTLSAQRGQMQHMDPPPENLSSLLAENGNKIRATNNEITKIEMELEIGGRSSVLKSLLLLAGVAHLDDAP